MSDSPQGFFLKTTARFRPGGIGRHISWLLLHSGIEAVTMTVASLAATRYFGPIKFGQLALLLTGVHLIANLGDGLYNSLVKVIADGRAREEPGVAYRAWRFLWITMLFIVGLAVLMGVGLWIMFPNDLSGNWILMAVGLAITRTWRSAFDGVYRGMREFRIPAVAGVICTSIMSVAIIVLTLMDYRVTAYMAVMLIGSAVNCIWLLLAYRRKFISAGDSDKVALRMQEFVRYSIPLTLRAGMAFLFIKINIWLLGWLETNTEMAGQFRLTDQFITVPALILSAVLAAVAPRIAEAQVKGGDLLENLLGKVNGFMLVLTVPMAIAFVFNGPMVKILFPDYALASRMLVYFAPSMLMMGLGYASSIALIQGGKPGAAFFITTFGGVGNVTAALIGYRLGGVEGLAVGTACIHFVVYLLNVVVAHRLLGIKFRLRLH